MNILNLTQHPATAEQVQAGVVDLPEPERAELCKLLTFSECPSRNEVSERAADIAALAMDWLPESGDSHVMIGGALFLMSALELALMDLHMWPVYAFSRRESVEQVQPDGSVKKTAVFRHAGFVK